MGWDNSTEMLAAILDATNYLTRLFRNANFKDPDGSEIPRTQRPYEDAQEIERESISIDEFAKLMKGDTNHGR